MHNAVVITSDVGLAVSFRSSRQREVPSRIQSMVDGGRGGAGLGEGRRWAHPVLCELIEEPIKQSAKLSGVPIKGRVKRALRKALGAPQLAVGAKHPNPCWPPTRPRLR